jgi:hypothetical protein
MVLKTVMVSQCTSHSVLVIQHLRQSQPLFLELLLWCRSVTIMVLASNGYGVAEQRLYSQRVTRHVCRLNLSQQQSNLSYF